MDELEQMFKFVTAAGYGSKRIRFDPSVVRGLEYYTGPVYEAELTFPVVNDEGQTVRFGSVAGGGRYDGLVGRFRAEPVPATGFSIGVSRLLAALKAVNSPLLTAGKPLPLVVVTAMDRERIADYQRMVAQLRALRAGDGKPLLRAEMYLGEGRFGAQMKYADRRDALCAVIQGSDAKAKGEVQVKDLKLGAELASLAKSDRDAYLRRQAEAQASVPENELGEAVRKVMARHSP
jgi:histidyl-tRNA synthetase